MNIGSEVIVMPVEEARILLCALDVVSYTKDKIKKFQKDGTFRIIDNLRDVVRTYDRGEEHDF